MEKDSSLLFVSEYIILYTSHFLLFYVEYNAMTK